MIEIHYYTVAYEKLYLQEHWHCVLEHALKCIPIINFLHSFDGSLSALNYLTVGTMNITRL